MVGARERRAGGGFLLIAVSPTISDYQRACPPFAPKLVNGMRSRRPYNCMWPMLEPLGKWRGVYITCVEHREGKKFKHCLRWRCFAPCPLPWSHRERISRLLLMMAGERREVSIMTAGSIAAVVGLKHVSKCHLVPSAWVLAAVYTIDWHHPLCPL